MPSNKDLKAQATELTIELGRDPVELNLTLNNVKLLELVKSLRAEKTALAPPVDPDATPPVDSDAEAKVKAKAKLKKEKDEKAAKAKAAVKDKAEAAKLPLYSVAPGKSITCKRGILADGDEMCAEYIAGGQEAIDTLVEKGYVIKS